MMKQPKAWKERKENLLEDTDTDAIHPVAKEMKFTSQTIVMKVEKSWRMEGFPNNAL